MTPISKTKQNGVKTFVADPDNLSLTPETHMMEKTVSCKLSCFDLQRHTCTRACAHVHTHANKGKNKNQKVMSVAYL